MYIDISGRIQRSRVADASEELNVGRPNRLPAQQTTRRGLVPTGDHGPDLTTLGYQLLGRLDHRVHPFKAKIVRQDQQHGFLISQPQRASLCLAPSITDLRRILFCVDAIVNLHDTVSRDAMVFVEVVGCHTRQGNIRRVRLAELAR